MLGRRQLAIAVLLFPLAAFAQVGTPVRQAQTTKTSGNLTATAAAAANCDATKCVTVSTTGYGVATVTVHGTYAGSTLNFEFSDDGGTTYYTTQCTEANAAVQESSKAPGTNASMAWDCGVFAATNFEVRQSAVSSGTAVVNVTLSAAAIEPAATVSISGTGAVNLSQIGGTAVVADPCQANTKSFAAFSGTANMGVVTGTSAKNTYICSFNLITATAQNIALIEGTGTACVTTQVAGLAGGTTAATGWNFAANGGLTFGNGAAFVFKTGTNADNVCLMLSGSGQVSGSVTYVQQ